MITLKYRIFVAEPGNQSPFMQKLGKIASADVGMKLSIDIARIIKVINEEGLLFKDKFDELRNKFVDPETKQVLEWKQEESDKAINELLDIEFIIDKPKLNIDSFGETSKVTAQDLLVLEQIIDMEI